MPYITSIERIGREQGQREGRQQGRQEGRESALQESILDLLEARFGTVPYAIREHLLGVHHEDELKRLHRQAALAPDLDGFQKQLTSP